LSDLTGRALPESEIPLSCVVALLFLFYGDANRGNGVFTDGGKGLAVTIIE